MIPTSKGFSKQSSLSNDSHWTERTTDEFVYRIAFDFARQIEDALKNKKELRASLATKLGVTAGRVSQTLNNPSGIGLRTAVKYARAIGKKVALVMYDDDDQGNRSGPINSEIFARCWERAGCPHDFFDLETATTADAVRYIPSLSMNAFAAYTRPQSVLTSCGESTFRDVPQFQLFGAVITTEESSSYQGRIRI